MLDPSWRNQARSPEEVVSLIQNGSRVFVHGAAATPTPLLAALALRESLEGVRLYHLHTAGPYPFTEPGMEKRVRSISFFAGQAVRPLLEDGRGDFIPVFLSDIPGLFWRGEIPLDVAMVQLSPPDRHGYCSLGTSVDAARAAVDTAKIVVAEINEQMPRTLGATAIPLHRIHAFTTTNRPMHEATAPVIGEVEDQIGALLAPLIEDGATLQMGIGAIPDAVLRRLGNKNDLGIHTEMFSDGLLPLLEQGNVTNKRKKVHPGRTVTSFVNGSRRLYDHVHDNPLVEFHPCDRTNDTLLIRKNDNVVAINSAIEIDLSGQVCADSIGFRIFSGIGGQMDFLKGAAESKNGKPIVALPSTASRGTVSRIVPSLKTGAGVVTTRGHVHWIATEYGVVNLHGLTLRERGEALISIAHPDFRGELQKTLREVRHFT